MSDKPAREDIRQKTAYYVYENMATPSVAEMWDMWVKHEVLKKYKRPALRTLEEWRSKYDWVERREAFQRKVKEEEHKKRLEAAVMKDEEILAITRAVMIRYGQQLKDNSQGKIGMGDFKDAVMIQHIVIGKPTQIGKQEISVTNEFTDLSDEELLGKLERFTKRYKEKLKGHDETGSR